MESYSRWEPIDGIDRPFLAAEIQTPADAPGVRVHLIGYDGGRDLLLDFGPQVFAFMSHDEFLHPWNADPEHGPVPKCEEAWNRCTYPLLHVHDSRWVASFTDSQLLDSDRKRATHYRIVSLDHTVDVLTSGLVSAAWDQPPEEPQP
jgi:hypothetical protein